MNRQNLDLTLSISILSLRWTLQECRWYHRRSSYGDFWNLLTLKIHNALIQTVQLHYFQKKMYGTHFVVGFMPRLTTLLGS